MHPQEPAVPATADVPHYEHRARMVYVTIGRPTALSREEAAQKLSCLTCAVPICRTQCIVDHDKRLLLARA